MLVRVNRLLWSYEATRVETEHNMELGRGQMGSALMGSLQISCFLTGTFWVLPLACFYPPKSAREYLFPQSVPNQAAAPMSVNPIFVRNQRSSRSPGRACPIIEIRQEVPCRAIRGNSISVNSTLPPLWSSPSKNESRPRYRRYRLHPSQQYFPVSSVKSTLPPS